MTIAQMLWLALGVVLVVLIALIAKANLQHIYQAEPSFVLGLLLGGTSVCFTRAFSRKGVDTALAMIREGKTSEIAAELDDELAKRLHAKGVHSDLALVKRNVVAAGRRAAEFYDLQSKDPRFYLNAPLLRVILDDLDEALANVISLERAADSPEAQSTYVLSAEIRSELGDVLRDVREAVQRRNETYEALVLQFERESIDDLWGAFAVLSSDSLKALRDLEALTAKCLVHPPDTRLAALSGYLSAAIKRAHEVDTLIRIKNLSRPPAMGTLIEDLTNAQEKLTRIELGPRRMIEARIDS
ncbi:hypothetical protein [Nonomuraea sp. NPDC050310]|uniref:hypothetical protein n=1 Tax=unclassified Nonomuraea TaxID=2593643 RepID=UPI0033D6706D